MNVIIGNFFLVIIWGIIIYSSSADDEKKDKIFLSITFVQLVIVHSFMDYNTIHDIPEYYDTFETMKRVSWSQVVNQRIDMESGFLYYMKAVSLIFPNFRMFLIINSVLMLFPYFYAIKKYTNYSFLAVLIILSTTFNPSLYVLRQQLTMGLFLLTFRYIEEKKMLNFLLAITFLCFFHNSAGVCFILYYICQINDIRKYTYAVIIACISLFIAQTFLINYIGNDVFGYGSYLNNRDNIGNSTNAILYGFYLLLFLLFLRKDSFLEGINRIILSCLIIAFLGSIIGTGINSLASRMFWHYRMILFLAVPIMNDRIKDLPNKIIFDCIILFTFIYPTLKNMYEHFLYLKYVFI